jgi:hypothetical protein
VCVVISHVSCVRQGKGPREGANACLGVGGGGGGNVLTYFLTQFRPRLFLAANWLLISCVG